MVFHHLRTDLSNHNFLVKAHLTIYNLVMYFISGEPHPTNIAAFKFKITSSHQCPPHFKLRLCAGAAPKESLSSLAIAVDGENMNTRIPDSVLAKKTKCSRDFACLETERCGECTLREVDYADGIEMLFPVPRE